MVQEILFGLQETDFKDQTRPKTVNYKAMLQTIEANPASNYLGKHERLQLTIS